VKVEADEVTIDDVLDHLAVLGEPDVNRRGIGRRPVKAKSVGGRAGGVRVASDGDGYPVGYFSGCGRLMDLTVASGTEATGADGKILLVDGRRAELEVAYDSSGNTKVLCQGLRWG
jgi:hypothetical protein